MINFLLLSLTYFFFLPVNVFGEVNKLGQKEIEKIEKEIETAIFKKKMSKENLFYHYLLAARNLRKQNYPNLALKYYRKGLNLKVDENENRLKAMGEVVFLLEEEKKFNEVLKEVRELERFAKKINYLNTHPEYQYVIDYFKVIGTQDLTRKSIGKDYTHFKETTYFPMILQYEFQKRMSLGLFKEAYNMFENHENQMSQHDLRAAHDLLATILDKDPKKWQCDESLRKYRESPAPSIKICLALERRRQNQKIDTKDLIHLLEKKSLHSEYFIPAVKKL